MPSVKQIVDYFHNLSLKRNFCCFLSQKPQCFHKNQKCEIQRNLVNLLINFSLPQFVHYLSYLLISFGIHNVIMTLILHEVALDLISVSILLSTVICKPGPQWEGLLFSFGFLVFRITLVYMHFVYLKAFPRHETFFSKIVFPQLSSNILLHVVSLLKLQSCWTRKQLLSLTTLSLLIQQLLVVHWNNGTDTVFTFFIIQSFLSLGIST